MHDMTALTQDMTSAVDHATIEAFREDFRGELIRPGDDMFDSARRVFNAMIDRRPALIARATGPADVIAAVTLARESGLPLAVRCGGHSVAGSSVADDALVIDLSRMKGVRVDPAARTARANAGVLWGEFDRETQLFGLATPGGRVTTTGLGGFTLGGGYGWLSPTFGLTCDNLISADVVTADGRLVTASERENADLFWGLRGAGSNFGVVTSYEFQLHPLGPIVMGGLVMHPIDQGQELARAYREYVESAPDELATALAVLMAPPAPFVPEHLQGKPILGIVVLYAGPVEEAEAVVAPLRGLGQPAVDLVQPMPYTAFQALLDQSAPWGLHAYSRALHLQDLSGGAIDTILEYGAEIATYSPWSQTVIYRHGGAVSRVPEDATAVSHRGTAYLAHPIAAWEDPADTDRYLDWIRRFSTAMQPFTTGGVYLNLEGDNGADKVRANLSAEKYAKLAALKTTWDPENLFRLNQNITPGLSGSPTGRVAG
jgi:FAD/FMN-containing dehydrogenase